MADEERDTPLPTVNTANIAPESEQDETLSTVESEICEDHRSRRSSLSFSSDVTDDLDKDRPRIIPYLLLPETIFQPIKPIPLPELAINTSPVETHSTHSKGSENTQSTTENIEPATAKSNTFWKREVLGWLLYEVATSPFLNIVLIAFMGPFLTIIAEHAETSSRKVSPILNISHFLLTVIYHSIWIFYFHRFLFSLLHHSFRDYPTCVLCLLWFSC